MGFIEDDHFDDAQCLALLGRVRFGRVALSLKALPIVVPVDYIVSGEEILFAMPLDQVAKALDQRIAALQADGVDEDSGQRWTALAIGPVRRLEGIEIRRSVSASLSLPGSDRRGELFRLQPAVLSGRWMDPL